MISASSPLQYEFLWKGLVPYEDALQLQLRLWQNSQNRAKEQKAQGHIIGLEHPTIITLGKRGNAALDIVPSQDITPIVSIDRGGQATLHSPGQLVIYPIFPLGIMQIPILKFVTCLHQATQKTLLRFKVATTCPQNLGLFTGKGKIAFTGMRVEGGVSRHGIAININNDLGLFSKIRSCGISDALLDKLGDHVDAPISCKEFYLLWQQDFTSEIQAMGLV